MRKVQGGGVAFKPKNMLPHRRMLCTVLKSPKFGDDWLIDAGPSQLRGLIRDF
jgi:hypothetical protein